MASATAEQAHGWLLDNAVLPNARLRQGDLVRFESATDELRKLAIVATADCDLEQTKHARTITLVPVVPVTTILEMYFIPDDCEKKKRLIEQFVFKSLCISQDKDDFAKYALLRESSDRSTLDLSSALMTGVEFLLDRLDAVSLDRYNILMSEMKTAAKKVESFKSQLRSRGDLLVLPEAKQLGVKGHLAWVRQLWQISASDVALRTSEISARPGERIARLDSPYRYRLTQLIAHVFSDIGLPNLPDSIDEILDEVYR